jgi:hypothetical protein
MSDSLLTAGIVSGLALVAIFALVQFGSARRQRDAKRRRAQEDLRTRGT